MDSPSEDIANLIALDSGLSFTIGGNLFVSEMPASPDECVAIKDTGGYEPYLNMDRDEILDRPTIQILVRGYKMKYRETYSLCETIKRYLHGISNIYIGTTRYLVALSESDIISLGNDSNNRPLLSCNFLLMRTA